MVQEFKDYDRIYAKSKGKLMRYEQIEKDFNLAEAESALYDRWHIDVDRYTNAEIRDAVYFAEGAEEWQEFRVSLKGFNTRQKLYRLAYRYFHFEKSANEEDEADIRRYLLECLRIDNYIGALVRGGQLDTKLNVVR